MTPKTTAALNAGNGSFQRRFTLPSEVATDAIKAEYSDGVLTLSIPKPEAAKSTEVPITTGS